ncbi:hypothetical protein J2W95_000010 [Flavobacterium granuli]|uniref:YD repeat-containing protein n=1 Tax=Flavobacterium granuli TaxID=280093 RepID=A0ABU1RY94_9FLAO|nr:hypothetical protein [Flavobacterium granuli]
MTTLIFPLRIEIYKIPVNKGGITLSYDTVYINKVKKMPYSIFFTYLKQIFIFFVYTSNYHYDNDSSIAHKTYLLDKVLKTIP